MARESCVWRKRHLFHGYAAIVENNSYVSTNVFSVEFRFSIAIVEILYAMVFHSVVEFHNTVVFRSGLLSLAHRITGFAVKRVEVFSLDNFKARILQCNHQMRNS